MLIEGAQVYPSGATAMFGMCFSSGVSNNGGSKRRHALTLAHFEEPRGQTKKNRAAREELCVNVHTQDEIKINEPFGTRNNLQNRDLQIQTACAPIASIPVLLFYFLRQVITDLLLRTKRCSTKRGPTLMSLEIMPQQIFIRP